MCKEKKIVKLSDWSVGLSLGQDLYKAPELVSLSLAGYAEGHPKREDKYVITSSIKKVSGRFITTKSGTIYRLGAINPGYRRWLKKNKPNWDWRNPITVIKANEE